MLSMCSATLNLSHKQLLKSIGLIHRYMATSDNLLPTPSVADTFTGNLKSTQQKAGSKHSVNLPQAVEDLKWTSSREGFPASLFPKPGEDEVRRMIAISGQRCSELLEKLPRVGSSVKMLADYLLGTKAWYSSKSALTWRMKVTKSSRLLFQLFPSTPRTEGIESGLLRTVNTNQRGTRSAEGMTKGHQLELQDQLNMIPTPNARDGRGAAVKTRDDLDSLIDMGATKGGTGTKTGLKLQPSFALWMMGYPTDWLDLEDGEMPLSKAQATRLSRKLPIK
jgi:hypothetical protein